MLQLLVACILVLAWVPWCINRWKFRHVPGPFAPPVLGNLIGIARMDMIAFMDHCRYKYGKIFKMYIGSNMIICVADPAAAGRMLSTLSYRHSGIQLTAGKEDWDFLLDSVVGANGSTWRTLRAGWQPAFSPTNLASYQPATQAALDQLVQRPGPAAASGEVVELTKELTRLTMDIVGTAAYGVDLHHLEQQLQQQQQQQASQAGANSSSSSSSGLLSHMQAVFDGGGVTNSSLYMAPVLMFPALTRLWQWMAYHCPDRKLHTLAKARYRIQQVSLCLLRAWRAGPVNSNHSSSNGSSSSLKQSAGEAGVPQLQVPPPGAFPMTLLAVKDKETGQPLSADVIVSQLNTFILVAFESTAAAILFTIYYIAQHPAVEARLVSELTAAQQAAGGKGALLNWEELPYTEAVIKESLRLLAPGAIATRFTDQQSLQLTPEILLPPKTALFACIYSMQRDPTYWPHALEFKPERWLPEGSALQPSTPDAYMPWGAGARLCVGKPFANQAITATIAHLYLQYSFQLEPGQVPLPVRQTFALVPAQGLRVRLRRRSGAS